MGYQRISPDRTDWVREIAQRFPREWEAARKRPDGSRDDTFIRILAFELNLRDSNIGLNGKRGGDQISGDALAYRNGSAPGGAEVIDVIVGSNHTPAWQDVTIPPGTNPNVPEGVLGRFIQPTNPGGSSGEPGTGGGEAPAGDVAALRREVAELRELLQGTIRYGDQIGLRAEMNGKLLCADRDQHDHVIANRTGLGPWERFTLVKP